MSIALSQPTLASQPRPSFCDGRKFTEVEQALLWTLLQHAPQRTSRDVLAEAAQHQIWPRGTLRQINRWRATQQRSRGKGRPSASSALVPVISEGAVVSVTPRLACVGVHLFARGLAQHEAFEPVMTGLKEAITTYQSGHPDEDFAL